MKICKEVLPETLKSSLITEQFRLYQQQTEYLYVTYLHSFCKKTTTLDDLANFPKDDSLEEELDWLFLHIRKAKDIWFFRSLIKGYL